MSKEIDYKADLQIDPDALDVEWTRQAELYMKYCELAADAKLAANKADERVKIIRSELLLEAREIGGAKTGAQEEAYYRTHQKHIDAKEVWMEAQHTADVLFAAQFAFNQRKEALENLVKLAGMGYFSTPHVEAGEGKGLSERIAERKGVAHAEATERLTGRRKARRSE